MRWLVEALMGACILGACLMIRWPTGQEYQPREAIGWVKFSKQVAGTTSSELGHWEKMADDRFRLWTRASVDTQEKAQSTLTWSGRVQIFTSPKGDLLISETSQIWSRDPQGWRAWLVRDAWELESAHWRETSQGEGWELNWRREGEKASGSTETEFRDRDLQLQSFATFEPSENEQR